MQGGIAILVHRIDVSAPINQNGSDSRIPVLRSEVQSCGIGAVPHTNTRPTLKQNPDHFRICIFLGCVVQCCSTILVRHVETYARL